ncbi:MBL fold metallo-hydrolase [Flavobacterium amniphilum]|uniref:MBL fold metallo-hydrolase n=1 Tax=Flavobacterium amniphilum TaxID=1834035 RepID=UPI00202A1981|nr:MBL fold metallo-hydrolase [Flavobacterium amniphilum]MCL9805017.1 MBL fold metallo-hydrolase [Flavobacterium amniphilum]
MFTSEIKSKRGEDICLLIKPDNYSYNFICECGDASELTVKECQNTEAVFISHTHIDHFANFDTILRHQIGIQRRVIICGPAGITKQVQSKIQAYQWNLISDDAILYEVREIKEDNSIVCSEIKPASWEITPLTKELDCLYSNDKFTVEFVQLDHKTSSVAYLFKERDTVKIDLNKSDFKGGAWVNELKNAFMAKQDDTVIKIDANEFKAKDLYHLLEIKKGDSLGVIMDHAAHQDNHAAITKVFENCNTVYIESFYKAEDKEQAQQNFHSYSLESARVMKKCNVQNAIPVHFSRKYNEDDVEMILEEFTNEFSN